MSNSDGAWERQSDRPESSEELEGDAELRKLGLMLRRRSPVLGAELDGRVMARIRGTPRARLLALKAWWLQPRTIHVSPLRLLGAGAAAALLFITGSKVLPLHRSSPASSLAVAAAAPTIQTVQFAFAAPGASQVTLVGDFNGWDAHATPLQPVGAAGVWAVEVPLAPGRHEYAFVVDGREWRPDPAAPRALGNEYGPPNSVITVGAYRL